MAQDESGTEPKKISPSLTKNEEQLIYAIKGLLKESANIDESVMQDMLDAVKHDTDETSHFSQFRWEGIDDAFRLKVAGSPFADSISSAFFQTHSYKYLDNPTFELSFRKELTGRALPTSEISDAVKHYQSLVKELSKNPGEQDSGWNPNMEDIVDVTTHADDRKAKYTDPFTGGGLYPEGDTYDKGSLDDISK